MRKQIFSYLMFVCYPFLLFAQWSDNTMLNTEISDTIGEQVLPKVVVNANNGESYISWFSEFGDFQYDVYMQRLDVDGNKLWAEDGLLISNHPTNTWYTDYDLAIDNDGCAILVTQDERTGNSDVYAYRMSPEGEFLWGNNGIALTNDNDQNPSPKAIVTQDGNIVFAWESVTDDTTQFWKLHLQKLSTEGQLLWDENVTISNDTMDLMLPYHHTLIPSEDNSTVIVWVETVFNDTVGGLGGWPNMYPYAQKIDSNGNFVWQNNVAFDTLDNMPLEPFFPSMISDGNSGFYIAWMAFPTPAFRTTYVQHVNSDGVALWTPNGVNVSSTTQYEHADPVLTYLPLNDELFVFWNEWRQYSSTDVQCAIFGQKFSGTGEKLWTNEGQIFEGWYQWLDSVVYVRGISPATDDDFTVLFEKEKWNNTPITHIETIYYAARIDVNGDFIWDNEKIVISSANSTKSRMVFSDLVYNQWITTWQDNRNDPQFEYETGVYAQNISIDGNIGPVSVNNQKDKEGLNIVVFPNPVKDIVNIKYELKNSGLLQLELLDVNGRFIQHLYNGKKPKGTYSDRLDISELSPGMYLVRLQSGNSVAYHKMIKK